MDRTNQIQHADIRILWFFPDFLAVVNAIPVIFATRKKKVTMRCSWPLGWSVDIAARNSLLRWTKHAWPANSPWPMSEPSTGREEKAVGTESRWAGQWFPQGRNTFDINCLLWLNCCSQAFKWFGVISFSFIGRANYWVWNNETLINYLLTLKALLHHVFFMQFMVDLPINTST